MKDTRGLTLIELVIVMCILGVMVLISIPNIGRWLPRYRLRSAVRDVASTMQLARLGAIKDNREWAIQYDINAQTYTILSDDGADGAWGTADDVGFKGDASPWTQSTRRLTDYRNVSFGDSGHGPWPGGNAVGDGITFTNDRVEFKPDGTASPVLNAACARIRFTATGAIEVLHWDGSAWM
jgi:prepilin-type N-terminal cleavage/methylation domain-containing protein